MRGAPGGSGFGNGKERRHDRRGLSQEDAAQPPDGFPERPVPRRPPLSRFRREEKQCVLLPSSRLLPGVLATCCRGRVPLQRKKRGRPAPTGAAADSSLFSAKRLHSWSGEAGALAPIVPLPGNRSAQKRNCRSGMNLLHRAHRRNGNMDVVGHCAGSVGKGRFGRSGTSTVSPRRRQRETDVRELVKSAVCGLRRDARQRRGSSARCRRRRRSLRKN